MTKLKDMPKVDRPREKFLKKGPDALSKSELLAIMIGTGIKGTNVKELANKILKKFEKNFLNVTADDLVTIKGVGKAKALQIASAIALINRVYEEQILIWNQKDTISKNSKKTTLEFVDFCAGIGSGRLGLENLGLNCVAFSEIDKYAEKTYRCFFGEEEKNYGDLMRINPKELPEFDLMIAGFPCQSFSVMGQRKGMIDERGQIIYGLIKIMKARKLPYFILENVKGLVNHEGGKTLDIILDLLDKAGYKVFPKVLSSLEHGVPQMRERIYFVGIRKELVKENKKFEWPKPVRNQKLKDCLIDNGEANFDEEKRAYKMFSKFIDNKYNKGLFEIKKLLKEDYLVLDTRQSDLRLYKGKVPTLRTGRHGIFYVKNKKFKKLSGIESLLLQGFPKNLAKKAKGKVADVYLLSQAGNAMTVNVIEGIGRSLLNYIGGK